MNELSQLLLEPSRPPVMRRSSSLTILPNPSDFSKPLRHRTSSLNYKEKPSPTYLRKRPSERNLGDMESEYVRHLEWNKRKQDIDFPSSSVTLSAVSPKGKRYDTSFLENPELLCRSVSGVLKGYIESTNTHSEDTTTPKGARFHIFERSSASPSNPAIEYLDLTKIINPAPQILEKRKFRRNLDTPSLIEIFKYIHHIFIETQMESECLIIALVYIERAVYGAISESFQSEPSSPASTPPLWTPCRTPSPGIHSDGGGDSPSSVSCPIETLTLSTSNWKAVVLTALLLASKIWDDFSMINGDFANICSMCGFNIDVRRLNELEKSFLVALDYHVFVKGAEYSQVYFRLQNITDRVRSWLADKHNLGKRQRKSISPATKIYEHSEIVPKENSPPQSKSIEVSSSIKPLYPHPVDEPLNTMESPPVHLATELSRSLFESIYCWIDEQLLAPTPQSSTPSPSKLTITGDITPVHSSPRQYHPQTPFSDIPYSISSPFVTHRRRASSMPASTAPSSLPDSMPLSSSLSESTSTSDLFGTLVITDHDSATPPANKNKHNCSPKILNSVLDIFERSIIQYQKATELNEDLTPHVEY